MNLSAPSIRTIASLMDEAADGLAEAERFVCRPWLCDELQGSAIMLRDHAEDMASAVEARDKLCREHFEDRLFSTYYISTIKRDGVSGWLVPVNCKTKSECFERNAGDGFYKDNFVEAAWQGYKFAMSPFDI